MNNQIIPYAELQSIGRAMAKSGYFSDAKDEAQAIVKILAGSEIGVGPFASMTGIHVIQGKPVLGANLIASLIKNDRRYNYRITEHTDTVCDIAFYEDGKQVGTSRVTLDELKRAGSKNLDKYPKNMLFARAISNGSKWHTPGIFGGAPIYTPDEFDMDVDEEGDVIAATVREPMPRPEPELVQNGNGNGAHGEPETLPFQWIMTAGLVDNLKHAANMANLLKLADLPEGEQRDRVNLYRSWRDYGLDTKPAAAQAIAGNLPDVEPEGEVG